MMLKKLILFIPALAFCFPVFAAIPQASGIYGEINAGYGKVDETIKNSHQNDNDGFGAGANLGYKFNPYIAIEGGYIEYPDEDFDNDIKGPQNFSVDLALKGILPLGHTGLSLFIKAGGAGVHHKLEDGTVFDSSEKHDKPLEFEVGTKKLIPGFEKAVIGMEVGEEKEIKLQPEEAYGSPKPEMIKEVPREQLPKEELKPGMMLAVGLPDGRQLPAKIAEVKDETVMIDLNHPLAGKVLIFKIKLLEVV